MLFVQVADLPAPLRELLRKRVPLESMPFDLAGCANVDFFADFADFSDRTQLHFPDQSI